MTRYLTMAALAAATLVLGSAAWAQTAPAEVRSLAAGAAPAPARLDDLKPMIGDWQGDGASAAFSPPANGQVIGHLALYAAAGPQVNELWILRPQGDSVLLRQKHYLADLAAREDKEQWGERKLAAVDAGGVYFNNLSFIRRSADRLDLVLRMGGANGAAPTVLTYALHRVR
jgi:hypothetical protein